MGGLVNGGPGKTDEGGVGQGPHQIVAQVPACGPVGLVNEHIDVFPEVEVRVGVVKLMDHGDDEAPGVVLKKFPQVPLAQGQVHVAEAHGLEVLEKLLLQLVAVHDHEHRGVLKTGVLQELLGHGDHGEGLPRAWVCQTSPRRFSGSLARAKTLSTARIWWGLSTALVSSPSLRTNRM